MEKPFIDFSSLRSAAVALSSALLVASKVESQNAGDREFYSYETCRASVIQHFEICYELGWKFMRRWLDACDGEEVDGLSKRALFRLAQEKGLISDVGKWIQLAYARNRTSHIYDEKIADDVYAMAKESKQYIDELIAKLEAKT